MNVILLNGAIASGKTTIGKAIVKQIREQQRAATFYDLDDETRKLNPRFEWYLARIFSQDSHMSL